MGEKLEGRAGKAGETHEGESYEHQIHLGEGFRQSYEGCRDH